METRDRAIEPTGRSTIVGVFDDRADAERAIDELRRAGFGDDQIGLARRDGEGAAGRETPPETEPTRAEGATTGAVTGAVTGGIVGAAGALLIPGIGPILAGGILATALGGAAIGAATGGLLGALVRLGVPEEEAGHYEREFQAGRTIVTVRAGARYDEAAAILQRNGANVDAGRVDIGRGTEAGTTSYTTPTA